MKKLVSILLIVTLAFTMLVSNIACSKKQLETPTGVTVSETGLISWQAVKNATGYKVIINGETYSTSATSYQVSSTENDFTYSIIATGKKYEDSNPTETYTFIGKGVPTPEPPAQTITVGITAPEEIKSGETVKLTARVEGTVDVSVTWSVIEGSQFATIDNKGNLTAGQVSGDKLIKVEARSKVDTTAFATKVITIVSKPELTQEMLDAINSDYVLFSGYINIELYDDSSIVTSKEPEQTYTSIIKTSMDGTNWYAEYENGTTGLMTPLYYKKVDNKPCQVGVNFMNEEEYFPMQDDYGAEISWESAGLYNSLKGLKVSDFTFDTDSWRWVYNNSDPSLVSKVIASSNPYDFATDNFALIIDGGEIMGIYSKSNPDYTISVGYKAIQHLYASLICGEEFVTVPTIQKYTSEAIHAPLNAAIENMRNLNSYSLELLDLNVNFTGTGYTESGYSQVITKDLIHFRPYTMRNTTSGSEKLYTPNGDYGYKQMRDGLYNTYHNDGSGNYYASRAYAGNVQSAMPTFAFAGEIFRTYVENEDGSTTYYVDDAMSSVASTFFYGVGNDINLYGIFATRGYTSDTESFTPFVTIKDGYIVSACFYYNIGGLMYGVIEIVYSDFNSASVDSASHISFETREVPTSWAQLEIIETLDSSSSTEDDIPVNALEYFKEAFGDENIAERMPFFGEAIGDTFGFGLTTYYRPAGSSIMKEAVVLYYDVPLDTDYTITTSIKAVQDYLKGLGFEQSLTDHTTFIKGDIAVVPVDENLDFMIYVYKI